MKLKDKTAVVTGGATGIGRALCRRFAAEGVRGMIVADLDAAGAEAVASETGGMGVGCDVGRESDVRAVVEQARNAFGVIDLFCSNAGIFIPGGEETPDSDWERMWAVNVKAHLFAARAVLPGMLARGEGYFLQTVSAAGLLSQIGSAPYAVTKHAALAFAEWLSIAYGDRGIRVSCICPQGVRTNMLPEDSFLAAGAVDPEAVADAAVAGIGAEQFLILPHPEVAEFFRRKAADHDRWIRGMRRLRASVDG